MSIAVELSAIRAQALAAWRLLTEAQRTALRRARMADERSSGMPIGRYKLDFRTHARTVAALDSHGLVKVGRWLTPLGELVRSAGIEQDERDAKRRYGKRGAS